MNPRHPNSRHVPRPPHQRGSLLIVAMILCAVIGISLVSYIQLSRTTLNLSTRSVYNNAAINIAEQGVEEAVYAINKYVADPTGYSWSGWNPHTSTYTVTTKTGTVTVTSNDKRRRFRNIALSQNAVAECRVLLFRFDQANPFVISRALIRFGQRNTHPIEKWIRVDLAKTSRFSNGMVARSNIRFTGSTAFVDSWNSLASDGTTVPYSDAVNRDNGTIGSVSVSADAVATWNAQISGFVSTGGADPTNFVGPTGSILGDASLANYDPATWVKSTVDPNRISTNFSATFESVTAPTNTTYGTLGAGGPPITFPEFLPEDDDLTWGTGVTYYYDAANMSLNSLMKIRPGYNVVLRLTGNLSTKGNGGFGIPANSTLAIYAAGSVALAGNAIMNGTDSADGGDDITGAEVGRPIQFQLWGTATTAGQSISITGTGDFSGVVYAPNADVTIGGTGKVYGSVVANTITMGGSAEFHYDESLGDFGGTNPFRVSRWRELTRAEDREFNLSESSWDTL